MTVRLPIEKLNVAPVLIAPPLLLGGALGVGLVIDLLLGWHLPMPLVARSLLGLILCGIGAVPAISAVMALRAAHTPVEPWKPTRQIVTTGPYKFSRNPIYLGLTLAYLGLVFILGSGGAMLLFLPVLATLHFGIVLKEEIYLTQKFGALYKNYCAATPRWLQ